jgi:hypothetical protein
MRQRGLATAALLVLIGGPAIQLGAGGRVAAQVPPATARPKFPVAVRPGTLGDHIDTLAGYPVRLPSARVVGVFDPRAFLIETETRIRPLRGNRSRVVVLVQTGALRLDPAALVASTVTVSGVARTLLGVQVTREVPWPPTLTPNALEELDIRAAVLAQSVTTVEGDDLLVRSVSLEPQGTSVRQSEPAGE